MCLQYAISCILRSHLKETRRSKIISRATGRYAATSFDQLLVCPRSSFAIVGVAFFFCPPRLFPVFDRLPSLDRPRLLRFPKRVMKKVFTHNLNTLSVYPAIQSNYTEVLGLLVLDFFSIFFFFFLLFFFSDRQTQNQGTHSTANKNSKWPKR